MSSLINEFVNFTEKLNGQGIDYAVCGGWATAIHGLPRATIDIYLLILSEDLEKVRRRQKFWVMILKVCRFIFITV